MMYNNFLGWAEMLLLWVFFIWLIVWVVKKLSEGSHSDSKHAKSATDILKERYAKGEIDKKEFEEKKKDLTN
ncbi:MAG: Electron transport complex protein rnfE [Parcubacteria group bacterium GW2011_GWA2_47_10]|nr:MAG: Electron transport complex protein rnfE [Parcubacteria group bacterium GW2011_GWA2_47_10]